MSVLTQKHSNALSERVFGLPGERKYPIRISNTLGVNNMATMHEMMDVNAKSSHKSTTKQLDHIAIHPAENGGHMVEHHFKAEKGYHAPEHHVFGEGDGKAMLAHVAEHMGVKAEPEPETDADIAGSAE